MQLTLFISLKTWSMPCFRQGREEPKDSLVMVYFLVGILLYQCTDENVKVSVVEKQG